MQLVFKVLKIMSFLVIVQTLVVMIVGSYVSASGAGLGCPDWPLCYGEAIPDLSEQYTLIEFTHRVLAATLSILVLSLVSITWLSYRHYRHLLDEVLLYYFKKIGMMQVVALSILGVQVLLGGMTVLTELPPEVVAIHLGTATVFFGMMIFITREIWHVSDHHFPSSDHHHLDQQVKTEDSLAERKSSTTASPSARVTS